MREQKNRDEQSLAPSTIGFRLDDQCRGVLGQRAAALGISAHELARHYVIEALQEREERTALRQAIIELRQEMLEARKDIAVSAEALLTSAGKAPAGEARSWTRHNLYRGE